MENVRFVGLDVHAESIAIAVAEPGRGEPATVATIPNDTVVLLKRLGRLGRVKCCYEAGPTGFGLHRDLAKAGIDCMVVAPSLVPTCAGDRVKTDRRDAVKLARFLRSGDLTEVRVPDEATEAMRDLERAREDAKRAELAARHQLGKFLLRHGRRSPVKTAWSKRHLDWIRVQHFEAPAQYRRSTPVARRASRGASPGPATATLGASWSRRPKGLPLPSPEERRHPGAQQGRLRGGPAHRLASPAPTVLPLRQADGAGEEQEPHGHRHRQGTRRIHLGHRPRAEAAHGLTAATSEDQAGGRPRERLKGETSPVLWARLQPAGCPLLERGSPRRIRVMR